MENVNRAQDLIGNELYDQDGNRIGRVGNVYVDDSTHQPEWVTVRTGMFGTRESFVPLQGAAASENRINVGVSRDKIRDAPRVDAEQGHLTDREGQNLYTYYGLRRSGTRQDETSEQGAVAPTSSESESAERSGKHRMAEPGSGEGARSTSSEAERGSATTQTASGGTSAAGTETSRQDEATAPAQRRRSSTAPSESETAGTMTRYEERLRVGTELVETGRVRLRKYVVTEHQSTTVPLSHEEVRIEHEEIPETEQRSMATGAEIGESEREVVLHEERPVTSTEPLAVERVRINTEKVTEEHTVHGDVRMEQFDIDDQTQRQRGSQET